MIRGIPSVEYGNLTSGIVDIKKIRRKMPLSARFKADGYSKLFSLGKGIALGSGDARVLNVDLGYLDSKVDPTDNLENYKRLNASLRYTLRKTTAEKAEWKWESALDYSGSFDNSKADPDLNYGRIDEYRSNYNRMVFTNSWSLKRKKGLLREVEVNTSVSQQLDRLHEKRLRNATASCPRDGRRANARLPPSMPNTWPTICATASPSTLGSRPRDCYDWMWESWKTA